MVVTFFESFKYMGHLLPVAFLRMFMGYQFIDAALVKMGSGYLDQPQLAAQINEWVPMGVAPEAIKEVLEGFFVTYWQIFAHALTYGEYVVGLGLILGFFVRPLTLIGILISTFFMFISNPNDILLYQIYIATLLTLSWLGAGRCMGMDYYFFKRHRGIWW